MNLSSCAVYLNFALLVAVLQAQFNILAQRLALLLGKRRHDGKHDLTLGIHRVDIFFFEENRNVLVLKLTDIFQAVQCISGKPADGLCDYHIDITGHALVNHAVEFLALFCIGAGDAVVRIDSSQFPVWVAVNVSGVVFNLRVITGRLLVAVCGNTAVGSNLELRFFFVLALSGITKQLDQYRSIRGRLDRGKLQSENTELRKQNNIFKLIIEQHGLGHLLGGKKSQRQERDAL